jgi:Holliday junction resolvase RusA-like endonuclease
MTAVHFTIYGVPQPAGSKRGFYNKNAGRVIITDDAKKSRPWKAQVSDAAQQAMTFTSELGEGTSGYMPLLDGPLALELVFYVPRPKGHYGSGRNAHQLRPSAPDFPAVKPDVLKLARAVEDALSSIVYRDDAQIVTEFLLKRYGEPARCDVIVQQERLQEVIAAA